MAISSRRPIFELTTNRIEALSDGVFAIVMTLLILEVKVPEVHGTFASHDLAHRLLDLWPNFLGYGISFITLGVYWVGHHLHFYTINRADRGLLWINILFLMFISIVPFSTALISEYLDQQLPVIFYALNMTIIGLVLYFHWCYATGNHRLISPDVDSKLVQSVKHVILMGPVIYVVAIGCSFIDTRISILLYFLVNLLYIIPGGIHLHLRHKKGSTRIRG